MLVPGWSPSLVVDNAPTLAVLASSSFVRVRRILEDGSRDLRSLALLLLRCLLVELSRDWPGREDGWARRRLGSLLLPIKQTHRTQKVITRPGWGEKREVRAGSEFVWWCRSLSGVAVG